MSRIAFSGLLFISLGVVSLGVAAQSHNMRYISYVVGQKVPDQMLADDNVIKNYSHYHVSKPQDGYEWIHGNEGNILLVSVKSHIISKTQYRPNVVPESK
ncbi:RcnB family protein [Rhodanobacter sp. Si-c]|uniref:RcnB family protein n=1 Tax=Rhodanobacter lycopersici TaxID=3162487 RepID=A0ABV3QG18_9GAMM